MNDEIVLPVKMTKHVKTVLGEAEKAGLTLVAVTIHPVTQLRFEGIGHRYLIVTLNSRGYLSEASGRFPTAQNWRVKATAQVTSGEALEQLLDLMPRYGS